MCSAMQCKNRIAVNSMVSAYLNCKYADREHFQIGIVCPLMVISKKSQPQKIPEDGLGMHVTFSNPAILITLLSLTH